jgi:hypothetical protein
LWNRVQSINQLSLEDDKGEEKYCCAPPYDFSKFQLFK